MNEAKQDGAVMTPKSRGKFEMVAELAGASRLVATFVSADRTSVHGLGEKR